MISLEGEHLFIIWGVYSFVQGVLLEATQPIALALGAHPVVFRLCTQGLLLASLGGPYALLEINPRSLHIRIEPYPLHSLNGPSLGIFDSIQAGNVFSQAIFCSLPREPHRHEQKIWGH